MDYPINKTLVIEDIKAMATFDTRRGNTSSHIILFKDKTILKTIQGNSNYVMSEEEMNKDMAKAIKTYREEAKWRVQDHVE